MLLSGFVVHEPQMPRRLECLNPITAPSRSQPSSSGSIAPSAIVQAASSSRATE